MKEFNVELETTTTYSILVKAKNEEEAEIKAIDKLGSSSNRSEYWLDESDPEVAQVLESDDE